MSGTVAYDPMKEFAKGIEKIFPSAVCSGIVGDARHARRGGYHIGRKFQPSTNYSVTRPQDRAGCGPGDGSSAADITMNRRDMMLASSRIAAAWRNANDPRRKYLNAVNGWLGKGNATRWDFYARKTKTATPDHKWHIHAEQRRAYIMSAIANRAIWSILRGESVAQWLKSEGVPAASAPAPKPAPGKPVAVDPKPKAPPYPGHVLRLGDKGRPVAQWQQQMINRGWKTLGKADGDFGPKTQAVVRRWQQLRKLGADGEIGPKTWPTPWTTPMGG